MGRSNLGNKIIFRLMSLHGIVAVWVLLFFACQRENLHSIDNKDNKSVSDRVESLTLVSAESGEHGKEISFSIELGIDEDEDEFRAKGFAEDGSSGAYEKLRILGEETAHCILRRKGDVQATTYVDIVWKGRSDGKIKFDDVKVKLPLGVTLSDKDEWYFTAILGGDEMDFKTGKVRITPGHTLPGHSLPQLDDIALRKIPYVINWTKLEPMQKGYSLSIKSRFKPLGTLLRLQFFSDMVEDYIGKSLFIETNALTMSGVFDPMNTSDEQLDTPPNSPNWIPDSDRTVIQGYRLHGGEISSKAKKLELPAGASWNSERTLYLWGMPMKQSAGLSLKTKVDLEVLPMGDIASQMRGTRQNTYNQENHRAFREGATYRLSNVLSSDLIISEIFYDYAEADATASNQTALRQNYSIVEVYNPTLRPIDLNHYALARLKYENGQYKYHTIKQMSLHDKPYGATLLQLSSVSGDRENATFGNRVGERTGVWYRRIYSQKKQAQRILEPGQTMLIAAGGYLQTGLNPSKNIDLFNEALADGTISESDFIHPFGSTESQELQSKLKKMEKAYYPRAGMQPDSAIRLGLCDALAAIDDGSQKGASPVDYRGGTLQLGVGQGVAIIKYVGNQTVNRRQKEEDAYILTDVSVPVSSSSASSYRMQLLQELQSHGAKHLTSLDEMSSVSYSYSRAEKDNFPHSNFDDKMGEWVISCSENDGGKSLGTRSYIAGLSPYLPYYLGYVRNNNRGLRPFWSAISRQVIRDLIPSRAWDAIPGSGGNAVALVDSDKIDVLYAEDAPHQPGEDISKAFDGDISTIYHTPHARTSPLPINLVIHFRKPERIDYMLYTPRQERALANGQWTEIDISYSLDGSTYQSLRTRIPLRATTEVQKIDLEGITAKSILIKVNKAHNGFASVAELAFRRNIDKVFDYSAIFTDESYGKLLPNVTKEQIDACPDPLYRDIARRLLIGKYDEFRVGEYKPYVKPNLISDLTKTMPYSLRDNVTGISVKAGETLIVRVAENYPNLRIVVQNLDKPNSDGFGGQEYRLRKGENRITIREKGLVYVLYFVDNFSELSTAQPIRIHFVTGKVNGYYDSQRHRGRWKELLSKSIDPYFDVVGEHAHLTYPTYRFRTNTPDGQSLIETYDEIVKAEKEFLGLYKYENAQQGIYRLPRSRMYLHAVYRLYMYATNYHTAFNDNSNAISLAAENLKNGVWGVAHEIGHINQTKPGLMWTGMVEVTVNLKSLYVQTTVFGRPSRWQVERDRQGLNRWFKSWNTIIKNREAHGLREDGSSKLSPFWQLELYFGKVLGKTPRTQKDKGGFYPDLYEYIRTNPNLKIPRGEVDTPYEQTEFVYRASKVAGYDLTDFFDAWGFFWLGNNVTMRYDYGRTFNYTLTENRVNEVKARVKSLSLPKLPIALEFITDVNYPIYKRKQEIVQGTATRAGRIYTLQNWDNIVAFEFVDENNRVRQYVQVEPFADTPREHNPQTITVKFTDFEGEKWDESYRLRAISYSGKRVEVIL